MKKLIAAVLVVVALCALSATADAATKRELRADKQELKQDNRCLTSRIAWFAGESAAYQLAWHELAGGTSDFLRGDKPVAAVSTALINASDRLNTDLNRIGKQPHC